MQMSPEALSLADYQRAFARRLRDPRRHPLPPEVPQRRMAVYEELIINNLRGFLDRAFPITRQIVGAGEWNGIIERFFAEHRCRSPLFRDIAGEFLDWVVPRAEAVLPSYSWLAEFMDYEWLELLAEIAPDAPGADRIEPGGNLMNALPALDPSVQVGFYAYPLHTVSPRHFPEESAKGSFCYLVMRGSDGTIRFSRITPATGLMLELLDQKSHCGAMAILALADQLGVADPSAMLDHGERLLADLQRRGAIIGTWRTQ
jgi:hypothetical protein